MPVISMFYGIIIRMFGGQKAVVGIPDGNLLTGNIQANKLKLVQAWIEIHQDELMADWQLALDGNTIFKIEALK